MRDERYFSSQSQKFNFIQNKSGKSVITINDNKEIFNAHKELASNDKETIDIDEKAIENDIQTNVNKNNCNDETVTNFDNNHTVLQVNVNNNKITSKDTQEHLNKGNDQETISSSQRSQNAPPNENETSKKITKKNKNSSTDCKRMYVIGDSILKHVQCMRFLNHSKIAKLHAYGFSIPALRIVYSYLKNRKQRTKINSEDSSWEEILFGVPQGSIPGSLFCNIFLCDLFYMMSDTEFASYADDNTPYVSADTIDEVLKRLETVSVNLFKWFVYN